MKYVLLAPIAILLTLLVIWSIGEVVHLSFVETNYITTEYVGLDNWARVFTDRNFLRACLNSVGYVILIPALQTFGALAVSLVALTLPRQWHDAARAVFYIPILSAGIIIAQVWRWLFHANGPINWLLKTDVAWFGTPGIGIVVISIIVAGSTIGGPVIIYLATMVGIPKSIFDAAKIDGASMWQIKLRIVLPIIAPIVFAMVLLAMVSAPQVFETIYALAPYEHTATMTFEVYREAFIFGNHGQAAAEAILLLFALGGMAYAQRRIVGE
jgi:multiple sugar transport system permease protein